MRTKFGIIPINKLIDHTFLKPFGTSDEIKKLCKEAKEHDFKSVCINASWIPLAVEQLSGSNVLICSVIGFPLGAMSSEVKVFEAQKAIMAGADEIDMVLNIGKLIEGEYEYVENEIRAIKQVIGGKVLKVIFENCLLDQEKILAACNLCVNAGADFVKTSTGFSTGGATFADVKLMSEAVKMHCEVKAAGGVRSYEDLVKMVENGATRIGTSSGINLMNKEVIKGGY